MPQPERIVPARSFLLKDSYIDIKSLMTAEPASELLTLELGERVCNLMVEEQFAGRIARLPPMEMSGEQEG
jgi:hypothetical protein